MKRGLLSTFTLLGIMTMCVSNASAQIRVGGKKLDTQKLLGAAKDAATAITLSDEDIARLIPLRMKRPSTVHVSNASRKTSQKSMA